MTNTQISIIAHFLTETLNCQVLRGKEKNKVSLKQM